MDLESATVDDAADFFASYYAPANAVLAVAGDLDVDETLALVEKHFGGDHEAARPEAPELRRAAADGRAARRRTTTRTRRSRAWRSATACPTPCAPSTTHLAHVLLAEVLTDGDACRLQRRLVQRDHLVTDIVRLPRRVR